MAPSRLALASALVAGLVAACLVDLPRARSCGDGWWDRKFEGCDPSSPERDYLDACRELGINQAGSCDPDTCEIVCCGDGVATGPEQCDGNDVRGETCPSGSGELRCTDACTLDYDLCPAVCGDGLVSATEECDPSVICGDDDDCGPTHICYTLSGECVPKGVYRPDNSCRNFLTTAHDVSKPYASGNVYECTSTCIFGRDHCGFCGDGKLDGRYSDRTLPDGGYLESEAEICDGDVADPELLHAHCQPLCVDEPVNADVALECEFDCMADCKGFAPPDDIGGGQNGCCLAQLSPCPLEAGDGVPDLPCCAWLSPDWSGEPACVEKQTNSDVWVCPRS